MAVLEDPTNALGMKGVQTFGGLHDGIIATPTELAIRFDNRVTFSSFLRRIKYINISVTEQMAKTSGTAGVEGTFKEVTYNNSFTSKFSFIGTGITQYFDTVSDDNDVDPAPEGLKLIQGKNFGVSEHSKYIEGVSSTTAPTTGTWGGSTTVTGSDGSTNTTNYSGNLKLSTSTASGATGGGGALVAKADANYFYLVFDSLSFQSPRPFLSDDIFEFTTIVDPALSVPSFFTDLSAFSVPRVGTSSTLNHEVSDFPTPSGGTGLNLKYGTNAPNASGLSSATHTLSVSISYTFWS